MLRPVFVEHTWKSQEFRKFAKRAKWDTINTAGSWSNKIGPITIKEDPKNPTGEKGR